MTASARRILVVGGGGREHALAWRLSISPSVAEVFVLPGNGGTAAATSGARTKPLVSVSGDPVSVALERDVDLVVVGPEGPLCDGLIDRLADAGVLAFGPSQAAARLEASKAFMKEFAVRHRIRTARHRVVDRVADVERAVRDFETPPVVKADGLCAGKGVVVAGSHEEAEAAARAMLSGEAFGEAGRTIVVEERIRGAEASVHAICDGTRAVILPPAQDHKRIGEGDTGPNTGGMGTYAPAPLITDALAERVRREIVERTVEAMASEGMPYRGALFAGLMVTESADPYLLEINVRFGDPETQVLMNIVDGDFAEALIQAARGELSDGVLRVSDRHALCVVLAAAGYPGSPRTGDPIDGLDVAQAVDGVQIYHAGTRLDRGRVVTSGGRVLGVTGVAGSLADARTRAYAAASAITFEGMQMRHDIGHRALGPHRAAGPGDRDSGA